MSKTIKYSDLAINAQRFYQQCTNRGTELTVSLLGFTLFNCSELSSKMMLTADVNKLATQQQLATLFMSGTETEKEAVQTIVKYLDKLIPDQNSSIKNSNPTSAEKQAFDAACTICEISSENILNIIKERGLDGKLKTNYFKTRTYIELKELVDRDVTRTVLNKLLAHPKSNQLIQAAQSIITYLKECNNKNNSCEEMKAGLNTDSLKGALEKLDIDWNDILYLYRPDDNDYYGQEVIKKDRNKNISALQAVFTYITTNKYNEPIKKKQTDFNVMVLTQQQQNILKQTTDITLDNSLNKLDRNRQARETYSMLLHDLRTQHVDVQGNLILPDNIKDIPFFDALAYQQPGGKRERGYMVTAKRYALEIINKAITSYKDDFLTFIANDLVAKKFCSNNDDELMIGTIYQYIKEAAAQCVIKDNNESVEKWQAAEKNIKNTQQPENNTTDLQNKIISRMFADLQQYKDNGDDNINGVDSKPYSVNPNRVGRLEAREQITATMRALYNYDNNHNYARVFISCALAHRSPEDFYQLCLGKDRMTDYGSSDYIVECSKILFHEKVTPISGHKQSSDGESQETNSKTTSNNSLPSRESVIAFWKMVQFYAQDGNPTIYNNSYINTDHHTRHAQAYRDAQEAKKTTYLQKYAQLKKDIKSFVAAMNEKDISTIKPSITPYAVKGAFQTNLDKLQQDALYIGKLEVSYSIIDGKTNKIELTLFKENKCYLDTDRETFAITRKSQVQQSS